MKNKSKEALSALTIAMFVYMQPAIAQKQTGIKTEIIKQLPTEKIYKYDTVPNDPLKARIYRLDNGLTVYMTVYKDAPRIQTYIVTKAGSKNDPADATGLAHYLEH